MSDDLEKKQELDDEAAVYVISVAAELSGLHPQTLRQYDRLGLVSPGRSSGRGRDSHRDSWHRHLGLCCQSS